SLRRIGVDADGGCDSIRRSFEDSLGFGCSRMARLHTIIVIYCRDRRRPPGPMCNNCPFTGGRASEAEE
ncbi:MAG: hypothetical protein OEM29_09355, partial [Thermoplasmata archaeon]|nr:hypothetical protein [Thermoplasmata archaeon]